MSGNRITPRKPAQPSAQAPHVRCLGGRDGARKMYEEGLVDALGENFGEGDRTQLTQLYSASLEPLERENDSLAAENETLRARIAAVQSNGGGHARGGHGRGGHARRRQARAARAAAIRAMTAPGLRRMSRYVHRTTT